MTGINASKIIQNLEFVNSFGLSSLAFFCFGFFILNFGWGANGWAPAGEGGGWGVGVALPLQLGPKFQIYEINSSQMGPFSRVGPLSRRNTCSGMTDVLLRLSYTQLLPAPFPRSDIYTNGTRAGAGFMGLCHDKVGSVFGPHEVDGGHVRGEDDAHDALHALVTPARVLPHWFFLNIAARKRLLVLGMLRSLSGTSIKSSAVRWRPRRSSRQPMHKAPPMVSMPAAFHHCHVPYTIRQAGQRSSDSQRNWLPPLPANIADTVQRSRHCGQSCGVPPAAARPTASSSIPYCGNASGGSTGKTRT